MYHTRQPPWFTTHRPRCRASRGSTATAATCYSKEPQQQQPVLASRPSKVCVYLYSAFYCNASNALRHGTHSFTCKLHHACLYSPAAEHHRPLAGTHFTVPQRVEGWVDLGGWLHTKIKCRPGSRTRTVTHPSTNRAQRRLTSLIQTNDATTTPRRHLRHPFHQQWTGSSRTVQGLISPRLSQCFRVPPSIFMGLQPVCSPLQCSQNFSLGVPINIRNVNRTAYILLVSNAFMM